MCDCAAELERRKNKSRNGGGPDGGGKDGGAEGGHAGAGGRNVKGGNVGGANAGGRGGSDKSDYWTNVIAGTALMGLLALLYKTFDIGTLWREKVNGIWGGVLDSMCHNYVKDPGAACLKINDCRRKWPTENQLKKTEGDSCQTTIIIELDDG